MYTDMYIYLTRFITKNKKDNIFCIETRFEAGFRSHLRPCLFAVYCREMLIYFCLCATTIGIFLWHSVIKTDLCAEVFTANGNVNKQRIGYILRLAECVPRDFRALIRSHCFLVVSLHIFFSLLSVTTNIFLKHFCVLNWPSRFRPVLNCSSGSSSTFYFFSRVIGQKFNSGCDRPVVATLQL